MSNSVNQTVHRLARLLSVNETAVYAGGIAVAVLLLFSLGVLVQVMLISREKHVSLRSAVSNAAASIWALPVIAMLGFFVYRVAETYTPQPPNAQTVIADRDADELPFQPTASPESWVTDTPRRYRNGKLEQVVISARGATVAHAERRLRQQAADVLKREYPGEADGVQPDNVTPMVTKRCEQPGVERVGELRNTVWQVHWLLDLSPPKREAVRDAAVAPRLWTLGGAVALLALIAVGVTMYLRLDASTAGKYRFRLRFATTVLLTAVGLLIAAIVPISA